MGGKEPTRALLIPMESGAAAGGISLSAFWAQIILHRYAVLSIGVVVLVSVLIWYSFSEPKYRAKTTVVIAELAPGASALGSIGSQLGGLASLAGLSLPGSSGLRVEALTTLESRELLRRFISTEDLIPTLFSEKWEAETETWITDTGMAPSMEKAVKVFQDNVLSIKREPGSDVVELSITWRDPELSARWANELVRQVNVGLRDRTIRESVNSIAFLEEEISKNSSTELQGAIYSLIEEQMGKIMLANVRTDFAFRVIDPATPPDIDNRVSPRLIYFVAGGGCLWVLICLIMLTIFTIRDQEN